MGRAPLLRTCVLGGYLIVGSGPSLAGGLYVSEIGTPASLGTGGAANVTNTFSADAAFTNPAGMTGIEEDQLIQGFQLIVPRLKFDTDFAEAGGDDSGNAGFTSAVPSAFGVKTMGERVRAGFAVSAPLGGGVNYGDGFAGRYGAVRAVLAAVGISGAAAYKFSESVSVGAGATLIYTRLDETIAINRDPLPDAKVRFDALDDWSWQGYAGITWQPTDELLFGALYRSEADVNLEGDANFRNFNGAPKPTANNLELDWDNPQLVEVGVRYEAKPGWYLFANADWEDWSEFSENRLAFEGGLLNPAVTIDRNWKDTWHLGIGTVYFGADRIYSAGVGYDSSPVDDDDRTIDLPLDRQLKASASIASNRDGPWQYSLGATLIDGGDAKVDQTAQGVRFKGDFETNLVLFAGGTIGYFF